MCKVRLVQFCKMFDNMARDVYIWPDRRTAGQARDNQP